MLKRSLFSITSLILATIVLIPACGSDDTSSGGGDVTTCGDLCELAPVDGKTASCVSQFITSKGYDTSDPACANSNSQSGCNSCYDAIHVSDGDCREAHVKCF